MKDSFRGKGTALEARLRAHPLAEIIELSAFSAYWNLGEVPVQDQLGPTARLGDFHVQTTRGIGRLSAPWETWC